VANLLRVRPWSVAPAGGIVHTDESTEDRSMLTGESMPVRKATADVPIGLTVTDRDAGHGRTEHQAPDHPDHL
jgi:Cu+-exporting ATPase